MGPCFSSRDDTPGPSANSKSLEDLSGFFSKLDARAILVTDCKLDDAMAMWYFFLLNFSRPPGSKVDIRIYVVGIHDFAGGSALIRHTFDEAKGYAERSGIDMTSLQISLDIFVTNQPGPSVAPRHEEETFAPYHSGEAGFPPASKAGMKYFQDLEAGSWQADFIGVLAQFLAHCVLDVDPGYPSRRGPGFDGRLLDLLVPRKGGVLVFQVGFNTRLFGDATAQRRLWDALTEKVKTAGAKILTISNSFSFAPGAKPGVADPHTSPFIGSLKQASRLWEHLFNAGIAESSAFIGAQIAKWIIGKEPMAAGHRMTITPELRDAVETCRVALGVDKRVCEDTAENYIGVGDQLKRLCTSGEPGRKQVYDAVKDLYSVAKEACGETRVDYLGRAMKSLENFGCHVEITDGQHLLAVLQSKLPVFKPCSDLSWSDTGKYWSSARADSKNVDSIWWTAKDIPVDMTMEWLSDALQVRAAYSLTQRAQS